jgi:phage terminase small subunit
MKKKAVRRRKPKPIPSTKHPPPDLLSERAAEIWIEIIEPLPADHFFASDLPILREYCETLATIERLRHRWDGEATIIKSNGDEVVAPVLTAINRNQTAAAQFAGKLRVCPSSRLSASKAGHESPKPPSKRAHLLK